MEWNYIDWTILVLALIIGYKVTRCITEWGKYDGC